VANVLRRVQRICAFYGARPQFICTSATIANPRALAESLLEAPVRLIDDDGAPRGARHVILYNPPLIDRALGLRRSSVLEAERIAGTFLQHQVQTIVFARSRLTTEVLLTYLRQRLQRMAGARAGLADADTVRGYRGGYLPQQRRDIEAGLRRGDVRAVVATNALELGVDIGQLGAAVLTGFPGTIASTWQQAGRAGRRQGIAVAVLVATAGALDQYVITHPRYFFERSPEHAYVEPNNLVILSNHLACATFELPFSSTETFGSVPFTQELLQVLAGQGVLHRSGDSWHWMSQSYPAEAVSLRAASVDTVTIVARSDDDGAPPDDDIEETIVGVLDRFSAPVLLHEGAVYLHEGQSYEVTQLDWEGGRARVRPAALDYYTEASGTTTVLVRQETASDAVGSTIRGYGDVVVTSQATLYRKVKLYTHENLGWGTIDLPEQTIDTRAYWLSLPDASLESLRAQGLWRSDPIEDYGPNWTLQRDRARARDGHRCTVCQAPELPGRQHDVHHIAPFRTFGYAPGQNEAYLDANRLENLVTLCRPCHRRAETAVRIRSGLAGLAYALANVAPLHLMCDPRDLGMTYEVKSQHNGMPTVTLYDRVAGGIGFAERLYELHTTLLEATRDLVMACGCLSGCPACVGPSLEVEEGLTTRQLTVALVEVAVHE
jgi:DEAD/DEAH box helicase domain-containing protein